MTKLLIVLYYLVLVFRFEIFNAEKLIGFDQILLPTRLVWLGDWEPVSTATMSWSSSAV